VAAWVTDWLTPFSQASQLAGRYRNFVEDSWFGEDGYFHSAEMRVIERLWKDGPNLVWQATVEDPAVLIAPWVMRHV
jgi:hypothetical protein